MISSRTGGRYFNIYKYTNQSTAEGSWGSYSTASIGSSNATNGEILLVPAMASGSSKPIYIALQSVPAGPSDRSNVSIYWKALNSVNDLDEPADFVSDWKQYQVSTTSSAYSTMTLDNNGNVAFLYEENAVGNCGGCYDIQFKSLSLETITNNAYTYTTMTEANHRTAFLNYDPWEGKVVTLKAKLVIPDGDTKYFYLHNEGLNLKVETEEPTLTDYSYYWVISKDPGTSTYYLSSLKGDGYMGKGYGRDYSIEDENADGAYKENIPVCTDDYQKTFEITGFVKQETVSDDAAVLMDGYAIKFVSGDSYRYVAVSEEGAINWFDHTAKGEYSNSGKAPYWTTDFEITEVERVYTPDTYGNWSKPTHFGFPVRMTRSDDGKGNQEFEGYYYYATLKLPFAIDLTKENVKDGGNVSGYDLTVLTCKEPKQNVGEKVILDDGITTTLKADGSYTLPRETPVMLRMGEHKTAKYTASQITLYFQPTFAKPIISDTGFKGTLGQKTFTDDEYNPKENANFFILGKKSDGRIKFYYMSNQTLAANKAYYVFDTTTGAKPTSLVFSFTDDSFTTGITQPEAIEPDTDGIIYDLSGRRITSAVKKGIYIRDGKKYIVK
ncbi:MAG: sialidase family protein [Prevotella sp.]